MQFTKVTQTCTACPSQWDAWDAEGQQYYVRYRWGHFTVEKDKPWGELVFEAEIGNGLDGCMTTEEMLKLLEMTEDVEVESDGN